MSTATLEIIQGGRGRYGSGDTLDEYVIERLLRENDLAEVYSARGPNNEHVVIKIFYMVGRSQGLASLANELKAVVRLRHPNILEYLNAGPGTNQFYLVMPFCEGGTLAQWIETRERIDDVVDACVILQQLASALECTHAMRIVHGDLKPENILISSVAPLMVKICDWDCAMLVGCARLPLRKFRGTPQYAAPEQLLFNTSPTCASDMFSLGVIMAEFITGFRLFHTVSQTWPVCRNEADLRVANALLRDAPALRGTIAALLSPIPEERPSASAVLQVVTPLLQRNAYRPPREHQITK